MADNPPTPTPSATTDKPYGELAQGIRFNIPPWSTDARLSPEEFAAEDKVRDFYRREIPISIEAVERWLVAKRKALN